MIAANLGRKFIATDATFRAVHTTRSRLTVSQAPFTLERDSATPFVLAAGDDKVVQRDDVIQIDTPLDLDYWEVDPAWDGKIFKSAAQAVRPVRSGDVPGELKIKTGSNVCIRLVTVQGEQYPITPRHFGVNV